MPTRQQDQAPARRHRMRRLAAGALGALAASGTPATAWSQGAPAPAPLPAAGETVALPGIDVNAAGGGAPSGGGGYFTPRTSTGTRTDTAVLNIPQSVNTVTNEAVRDLSMQNLQDVMRYVPGAGYAQGEGNRDTPVLRGQSTTASLFRNGMRDDVQYFRDLYNIDRVEVLLGPNAMIFGRGGAGGIVNRVTRQAGWDTVGEVRLQPGAYADWRGTFDVGGKVNDWAALRLMGMYEAADSYRDGVHYRRSGINPTSSFRLGERTLVQIGYENFRDERTADRGIPSYLGRPLQTGAGTFFGDPNQSNSVANVNLVSANVQHRFENGGQLNNQFLFNSVNKFYQNIYPSAAVNPAFTTVALSAYNNATQRDGVFNQTDYTVNAFTGPVEHKLLAGLDIGQQVTDNYRNTGFFPNVGPNATSVLVPIASPRVSVPVLFRHQATDANNHSIATSTGVFAQDQIRLHRMVELVLGLRYEFFNAKFSNNNTAQQLETNDNTLSPRAGLLFHPIDTVTLYASYMKSYLPRAGEQLSSLTATNQSLQPESFTIYEIGAKWEPTPRLLLTAALYRLDRTNVAVTNPQDVTQLVLVNGTRTQGVELSVRGRITDTWSMMGGYANTAGEFTASQSATVPQGNTVPFLSRNTFSLWNRYDVHPKLGLGLGIINQSSYLAAADNAVRIPGFTRADGAVFWSVTDRLLFQVNLENLSRAKYYPVADNNNNITPGAPFAARFALTARY